MYSTINRLNFASATDIPNYPDFLEIQVKSFGDFFQLETKSDERTDEGINILEAGFDATMNDYQLYIFISA